jgi:hypothetical protein
MWRADTRDRKLPPAATRVQESKDDRSDLLIFLIRLLGNELGLGQLSLKDGHAVIFHVALILQGLPYPGNGTGYFSNGIK